MPISIQAQDYSWWNQKHNWDGTTSWTQYIIPSAAFMGPNALPVPEVRKGKVPEKRYLELALDGHYSRGDRTGNLYTELYLPLFSKRVGMTLTLVPAEIYRTDTITRDLRRSREFDSRGISFGDLYISTLIHLVRQRKHLPDISLSVNLKTASGTRFLAARHTDAPGYYFDLSAGKNYIVEKSLLKYIRLYIMAGFYVYQTHLVNYAQNDAFLYGAGADLNFGPLQIDQQLGGYRGYLGNGDAPLVYRLSLGWERDRAVDVRLRFQHGISDFPYTSARLSAVVMF